LRDLQNYLSDFDQDQYDPNISWQIWKNKFFRIWNNHAPVKRRKVGTKRLDAFEYQINQSDAFEYQINQSDAFDISD
jgi:hypothetical protein